MNEVKHIPDIMGQGKREVTFCSSLHDKSLHLMCRNV